MHEEPSVTLCHNGSGSCCPYLTHNLKAEVLTVFFLREGWYNEVYKETTFLSKRNQTSPPFFLCTHLHALCVSLMSSQDSHSPINITQLARAYRHFKAHVSEQEFMKVAGLTFVRSQIVSAAVCFSTCVALATASCLLGQKDITLPFSRVEVRF